MSDEERIREHFRHQAKACEGLGSDFTAGLCRLLAERLDRSTEVGRRVLSWAGNTRDDALSLRLCGGLHGLVLAGADERLAAAYPPNMVGDGELAGAVSAALARHDEALVAALASPPQTNEIARSAMLLPGFLTVGAEYGMPLAIREIGSSAGLTLNFDRYSYRYGDACWGPDDSPVKLCPDVRGEAPPLGGFLDIASRKGADIAPLDVRDGAARIRLKSYVWADQTARLQRLDAALTVADAHPFALERADAAVFVESELAAPAEGIVFVLFHSIMWQYMPEATRRRIEDMLDTAGNEGGGPIAWLRMEPVSPAEPYATLRLTCWPEGRTRDLARCDYHGRWIEWIG